MKDEVDGYWKVPLVEYWVDYGWIGFRKVVEIGIVVEIEWGFVVGSEIGVEMDWGFVVESEIGVEIDWGFGVELESEVVLE